MKTNATDILKKTLLSHKKVFTASEGRAFFDLLLFLRPRFISKQLADFIQEFFEKAFKGYNSYVFRINRGILMLYLGRENLGLSIIENETDSDSYFDLARVGRVFLEFGYNELADVYFKKSVNLRPGNFMHHEFIGNAYFSFGRYEMAVKHFRIAHSLKPFLRHIMAHVSYCSLTKEVRQSKIFGNFSDLQNYFTMSQSFYEDSPKWK